MLDYKETYRYEDKKPHDNTMEFLTMQEAEDKFGKKGKTNAALTLGI